ncbi:MAG: peptidylprolyl isomerase, partial [Gammaproteobacteria bacterium]|nr:peptidylprolyl isomerase [Gammaproteobacteria bacterium]
KLLWQRAFNTLLLEKVLFYQLSDLGLSASDAQINAIIYNIPAFQDNKQFSPERYLAVLNAQGISPQAFSQEIKTQLINGQLRMSFEDGAFVLPDELNEFIALGLQTRDIAYAVLSAKPFAAGIKPTSSDINTYYEEHQDEFKTPETLSIEYLTLSMTGLEKAMKPSDAEIQQYYALHRDQYATLPAWQVAHIVLAVPDEKDAAKQTLTHEKVLQTANDLAAKLRQGADFAALAKQYSADPLTANKGGMLDWFGPGTFDAAFDNAVKDLKPGQISDPVKTKYGYEIIKLLKAKEGVIQPLAKVKPQIAQTLGRQKAEEHFANNSEILASLTYENPESLAPASRALNLPIQQSDFFTHQGLKSGIAANRNIIEAAFSEDVLTNGNNSDLITLDPNTVIVLRVSKHNPESIRPLSQVSSFIRQRLIAEESAKRAKARAEMLLKQLQEGKPLNHSLEWISLTLKRNSAKIDSAIGDYAFTLPFTSQKQPVYGAVGLPSGDYALIQVKAVHPGEITGKTNDAVLTKLSYRRQLSEIMANYEYQQFLATLVQNASIKVEDKEFENQLADRLQGH